jgi:Protein of unknown function (DUF4238)
MNDPKLHHYVPQFYLRRFRDASQRLWVWDRDNDRIFQSTPRSIAAENSFYHLDLYAKQGHDPLAMEKQFAFLEGEVAQITDQWLGWIRDGELGMKIPIPEPNRRLVSLFLGLQFLRTADTRDILATLSSAEGVEMSESERRILHTETLWDERIVDDFTERINSGVWMFGRNRTDVPFITSDNPVAFRAGDNSMWLKAQFFGNGAYVVYPLAPDIVMYCHPREAPWLGIEQFDCAISPVAFNAELVESENTAPVFMASQFVVSSVGDFSRAREFAQTIGTNTYASYWRERSSMRDQDV